MVPSSVFSVFIRRYYNRPFQKRADRDSISAGISLSRLRPTRRSSYASLGQYLSWGLIIALFITCWLFVFFNVILLLSKSYVVSFVISNRKVDLKHFDLGPAPSWLGNPPSDFRDVVDQYTELGMTLSVTNNPSWFSIKVEAADVYLGDGTVGLAMRTNGTLAGDAIITLNLSAPFTQLNELTYQCLYYYGKTMKRVPLTAVVVFVPTILGQDLGIFKMKTNPQLMRISSTTTSSTSFGEPMVKRCDVYTAEDSELFEGPRMNVAEVPSLVYNLPVLV